MKILFGIILFLSIFTNSYAISTEPEKVDEPDLEADIVLQPPTENEITTTESDIPPDEIQWTDFSNLQIELVKTLSDSRSSYNIKFTNVTYINTHTYKIYISNSTTKPSEPTAHISDKDYSTITNPCIDAFLEKAGDIYLWVIESASNEDKTEEKIVVDAKKIERPAQNPLGGSRISGSFYNNMDYNTLLFFKEPSVNPDKRKFNVKIGNISDKTLLAKFQNKSSDALSSLLAYAKSAPAISQDTVLTLMSSQKLINSSFVDNAYYFVYLEADTENGTYYPVEDVSLYQYQYHLVNGGQLVNYLDSNFTWVSEDSGTGNSVDSDSDVTPAPSGNDTTTAPTILPNTGKKVLLIVFIIMITLCAIGYLNTKKYKEIK